MLGCRLLVDPAALVSFPTTTDALGDGLVTVSHLLDPLDLDMQWTHVSLGSNPLGVLTTAGMLSRVR